ncbi:MAG: hypothetical protein PVI11_08835 [Candidatus Aminicenantes bacterium]|jgi:hypothetical protein
MVSKKKKTLRTNLSLLVCVSLLLTVFTTGLKASTPIESPSQDILKNACFWILSFCSLVNPNSPFDCEGIFLWSTLTTQGEKPTKGDKTTKKTKTDKGRVKDHKNSTSRKPANDKD